MSRSDRKMSSSARNEEVLQTITAMMSLSLKRMDLRKALETPTEQLAQLVEPY